MIVPSAENAATRRPVGDASAIRILFQGRVQGIGFRPEIARLAARLGLTGWVKNTSDGVEVHVEGAEVDTVRFVGQCTAICPSHGTIEHTSVQVANLESDADFRILRDCISGTLATAVPVDLVTCNDCRIEIEDRANRRSDYWLTSCTHCGPRYTVIDTMPYDRAATSMRGFPLCDDCEKEYALPPDRRFHAQTTACSGCGPGVWHDRDPIAAIREGKIVAIKGLGGYQLLVDATNAKAVRRLRSRKGRAAKPFAVLVADLDQASRLAELSSLERELLAHSAGPIVIARLRTGRINADISPGLTSVGLMLPTTPLHHWMVQSGCPLVVTSGNREGEPLAFDERTVESELGAIADHFVHHDRPIRRPIDDSVVRVMAGRAVTLRLGRGMAPLPLTVTAAGQSVAKPESTIAVAAPQVLAVGAQQKVAVALSNGRQAVLGPHIGDLDSVASCQRFGEHVSDFLALYRTEPMLVVTDQHPDYYSTQWAAAWAQQRHIQTMSVQHHHAHIAAGMLEHGWLTRQVLGVAWDGTGLGPDATIWGGEFLLATATGFRRVAHLRPFCLPGGEAAIREPGRVAAVIVDAVRAWDTTLAFSVPHMQPIRQLAQMPEFAPVTTSAGRLFDAVAALILPLDPIRDRPGYEGHFAVLLEEACDPSAMGSYPFPLRSGRTNLEVNLKEDTQPEALEPWTLDWRPLIAALLHDYMAQVPIGTLAMRFHRSIAAGISAVCRCFGHLPVVFGGGVFQNRVLLDLLAQHLTERVAPVGFPGVIPPNDGGLAAGQLAIGFATLEAERRCA